MFQYFTQEEADLFSFYRTPKEFFFNPIYKVLSSDAKLLYGLLLDRNSLSRQNGWFDKQGYVFIYFSREEAMEMLGIAHPKASNLFKELREIQLIQEVKQGQGKPNIIYVGKFTTSKPDKSTDLRKPSFKGKEKVSSRHKEILVQDTRKSSPNYTYKNYTEGVILTHTQALPETSRSKAEKEDKNLVCVEPAIKNLQMEIKRITGYKVAVKKIQELLTESSLERIQFHLGNWDIHRQYQRNEGAGWFFTVVQNDIIPEKKKTGGTGKEEKIPQRDNFQQRNYSREELERHYADLTK